MYNKFIENIKTYNLIEAGDTVLAGVSGGYDSMSLLLCLLELKKDLDIDVVVLHVNHMVREEAEADEDFVRNFSEKNSLAFYSKNVDMQGYAKKKGLSEEDAGRRLRYSFFFEMAERYDNSKIATGHNLPDQVETVLLNLIRGSGLRGLTGMSFQNGKIIRPILNISREEIEDYVEKAGCGHRDDHTNFESDYRRNSIRNNLIPYIKSNYNPNFENSVFNMAELLSDDYLLIESLTEETLEKVLIEKNDQEYVLDKGAFENISRPLQNHLLRHIIEKLNGSLSGFSRTHIEEFRETATKNTGKKKVISGIELIIEYDRIRIFPERKADPVNEICLDVKNTSVDFASYHIELSIISKNEIQRSRKNIQYFDGDELTKIKIRPRQNGDRLEPFAFDGSKKVKDILIDEKIPKNKRDLIPVFTDGSDIIWLGGLRRSRHYLVKETTKKVLQIKIEEKDESK